MITVNGKVVEVRSNPKQGKEIDKWVKEACNRIFSHYSPEEMETLRKQNG